MGSPGRKQRLPKRETTRPEGSLSFQVRAYLCERGWGDCSKRKEIDLLNYQSLVVQLYPSCFRHFRLLSQNTIDWVASKQPKRICHSSRGWEVHAMAPEDSVSVESLAPDAQKTPHCILPWWKGCRSFTFHFHALEKKMATHSSVLSWRIPGTAEPGGLPSMGLHRVGHDWSDFAAAAV